MKPLKLLLVDDEEEFVSALAERLRLRGMEVETALDGGEALSALEKNIPDLVILDMMMPGMSGLEVLKRLKRDHPDLRAILLTGHGGTNEALEGMRAGACDFLMKPINITELIEKIKSTVLSTTG